MRKRVHRTAEEIQARYQTWANTKPSDHQERSRAWCAYVDARDGLRDGDAERMAGLITEEELAQLDLFSQKQRAM